MKSNKKLAKKWAEDFFNSKEGKLETEKINQEFKDYILFGKPTRYLNEEFLDEMSNYVKVAYLSVEDIVKKFNLNEKETKDLIILRDYENKKSI